jgi:HSP20 family protein
MLNLIPSRRRQDQQQLARRDQPLSRLRDDIDTLFEQLLGQDFGQLDFGLERAGGLDIEDRDDELVVRAEAPGFEPEEIGIELTGQMLTVRAEKKQEKKRKKKNGEVEERVYRSFEQSVMLPEAIESDKIQANYRNGVLEVHIPKSESSKPKRIEVQS